MMLSTNFCRRSLARAWRVCICVASVAPAGVAFAQTPASQEQVVPQSSTALNARSAPTVYTAYTPDATRGQLISRRDSLARFDNSGDAGRARRDEINEIQRRLTVGDFRAGDRFLIQDLLLSRASDRSGALGDTVVVRDGVAGPVFSLNTWSDASLRGVLRAELPATVENYERTYVREPRIRVMPLTRLSITGSVPRPGYYTVDPDRQFTDALTLAGGPGAANLKKGRITVLRDSKQVYDTKAVQTAIRDGRTLDDLGMRSGDEIRIEEPKKSHFPSATTIFFGLSAITGLLALIRSAYNTY